MSNKVVYQIHINAIDLLIRIKKTWLCEGVWMGGVWVWVHMCGLIGLGGWIKKRIILSHTDDSLQSPTATSTIAGKKLFIL